jgi:hypothetical protein
MATYDLTTTTPSSISNGDILNCPYSGASKTITLPKGKYKLECWGAEGGTASSYAGGKGGYSIGTLGLAKNTTLHLYTGGAGKSNLVTSGTVLEGGFNGGGSILGQTKDWTVASGGGGTDIRIAQDSLYARVIVAGGGGSATYGSHGYGGAGGHGGGLQGIRVEAYSNSSYQPGYPGTQTSGGASHNNSYTALGTFGVGGSNTSVNVIGGGGGGWYGGGSGYCSGSGGGSGYVYTSGTASNYPSGCLLNSSYYLTEAETIAGNTSFLSPTGTSETGHTGDGYIRITVISVTGGSYREPATFDITTTIPNNTVAGDIYNCPYSGKAVSLTLPKGTYKLECWGASGGCLTSSYRTNYREGVGGYSTGVLILKKNTVLYCYAGGAGTTGTTNVPGGFNGGGRANATNRNTTSGGGASDIRISQDSLYARVIVAGGGGGGRDGGNQSNYAVSFRGAAGGTTGFQGGAWNTSSVTQSTNANSRGGGGGGQTSPGTKGNCENGESVSEAGFGVGGSITNNSSYGEGGGGGWYGGGIGSADADAGGGSGYVYTATTVSSYPSGCLLNSSYYLTEAETIAGNTSFLSPTGTSETGHDGSGYVRITVISTSTTKTRREPKTFDITKETPDINVTGDVYNCPYSGSAKSLTLLPGVYKLECWGAQGGYRSNTTYGGKGGYSVGTLTLKEAKSVALYTGGAGNTGGTSGGWNGGGSRSTYSGGGGASDIRLGNSTTIYARVIVAGGGGSDGSSNKYGMYGGGLSGGSATESFGSGGGGGTQTAGGAGGGNSAETGSFGQGGVGTYRKNGYGGAGGGGWYGGGGVYPDGSGDDDRGGGGGSGYVYTSATAVNYPSGCLLTSDDYLTEASTIAGNVAFLAPSGTSETGHSGNGYIRITVIQGVKLFPTMYLGEKEIVVGYLGNIPLLDVLFRQKTDTEPDTNPDEDIVVPSNITNLVTNGDFENGMTGWTDMNDNVSTAINTITKADGTTTKVLELAVTSTDSINAITWVRSNTFTATAGHIYYARCYYKGLSTNQSLYEPKISIIEGGGSGWLVSGTAANAQVTSYTKTSAYGTCTISGSLAEVRLIANRGSTNTTIQVGNKVFFDDVVCYDLTETFGVGKEPTKEWCDENL